LHLSSQATEATDARQKSLAIEIKRSDDRLIVQRQEIGKHFGPSDRARRRIRTLTNFLLGRKFFYGTFSAR